MGLFYVGCLVFFAFLANGSCQHSRRNRGHSDRRHDDDLVLGNLAGDVTSGQDEADLPGMLLNLGLFTMYDHLEDLNLIQALRENGPMTVFGPADEAFTSRLIRRTRRRLENTTVMARTIQFHVLPERILASNLRNEMLLNTLLGPPIRFNTYRRGGGPTVYTAQCVPIVNSVTSQSGVVHTVDKLLLPPYGDMLTSLTACPVFKNLTTAMRMVNLDSIVTGPYTVFAATDMVFERAFPQGTDSLFRNRTALRELVYSHVVPGTQCSSGFQGGRLTTLSGQRLNPVSTGTATTINGVRLTTTDGMVSNGVVHCVNDLLWP